MGGLEKIRSYIMLVEGGRETQSSLAVRRAMQ